MTSHQNDTVCLKPSHLTSSKKHAMLHFILLLCVIICLWYGFSPCDGFTFKRRAMIAELLKLYANSQRKRERTKQNNNPACCAVVSKYCCRWFTWSVAGELVLVMAAKRQARQGTALQDKNTRHLSGKLAIERGSTPERLSRVELFLSVVFYNKEANECSFTVWVSTLFTVLSRL